MSSVTKVKIFWVLNPEEIFSISSLEHVVDISNKYNEKFLVKRANGVVVIKGPETYLNVLNQMYPGSVTRCSDPKKVRKTQAYRALTKTNYLLYASIMTAAIGSIALYSRYKKKKRGQNIVIVDNANKDGSDNSEGVDDNSDGEVGEDNDDNGGDNENIKEGEKEYGSDVDNSRSNADEID